MVVNSFTGQEMSAPRGGLEEWEAFNQKGFCS